MQNFNHYQGLNQIQQAFSNQRQLLEEQFITQIKNDHLQQELEKRVQKDYLQQVLDKNAADKIIQIKKKIQKKQNITQSLEDEGQKNDIKLKKKINVQSRNRISAQASRDKKTAYINQLEDQKQNLSDEKRHLTNRIQELMKELEQHKQENNFLRKEQSQINQFIHTLETKPNQAGALSMALFSALIILTSLNLNPLLNQAQDDGLDEIKKQYDFENFNINKDMYKVIKQYEEITYYLHEIQNNEIQLKIEKDDDLVMVERTDMDPNQSHPETPLEPNSQPQKFQLAHTFYSKVAQMSQQISKNWQKMQKDKERLQI